MIDSHRYIYLGLGTKQGTFGSGYKTRYPYVYLGLGTKLGIKNLGGVIFTRVYDRSDYMYIRLRFYRKFQTMHTTDVY